MEKDIKPLRAISGSLALCTVPRLHTMANFWTSGHPTLVLHTATVLADLDSFAMD